MSFGVGCGTAGNIPMRTAVSETLAQQPLLGTNQPKQTSLDSVLNALQQQKSNTSGDNIEESKEHAPATTTTAHHDNLQLKIAINLNASPNKPEGKIVDK